MHESFVSQQGVVPVHLSPLGTHIAFGGWLPHVKTPPSPGSQ